VWCVVTQSSVQAGSSDDDWPMFCHDPAHTGATTSAGPINLTELWRYKEEIADTHFSSPSSPAVAKGIAYFCSNWDGKTDYGCRIYALNAYTGAKKWSVSIDNNHISSSPAVSENRLFIGVRNDVIALDALSGAKIWNYTTGGVAVLSPVVTGGIVYVGSYNEDVYALKCFNGRKNMELYNRKTFRRLWSQLSSSSS
jgi:outer membrane protein assembly factor BamB